METDFNFVDNETCSIKRDNSDETPKLERILCRIKDEFAKISKHNSLGRCIEDVHEIEIHILDDEDEPKYVLKIYGKEQIIKEQIVKQAIDKFISAGHYVFYKHTSQLERQFPYEIGRLLNESEEKSEFWCSMAGRFASLIDSHDIFSFYVIKFNKNILDNSFAFGGNRHPFIDDIKREWEYRFGKDIEGKINYNELFRRASVSENFLYNYQDHFNVLSTMKYENQVNKGSIISLAIHRDERLEEVEKNYDISIRLLNPIMIIPDNYKKIRKLLEVTYNGLSLLMNAQGEVFAIGKIKKDTKRKFYKIRFMDFMEWKLYINEEEYLHFKNMFPSFPEIRTGMQQEDVDTLREMFGEKKLDKLIEIIEAAIKQKHGTIVVIAENAEKEVERLYASSLPICPIELSSEQIEAMTSIDGALMCDENGVCYAIGVILDGKVSNESDSSRGARYNSAIRYNEMRKEQQQKTFIVIVSEDGYIECISTN